VGNDKPRSHRRFLGRHQGSSGADSSAAGQARPCLPDACSNARHAHRSPTYSVGDVLLAGQGLNAVAFSGLASVATTVVGADLGLNPRALPELT